MLASFAASSQPGVLFYCHWDADFMCTWRKAVSADNRANVGRDINVKNIYFLTVQVYLFIDVIWMQLENSDLKTVDSIRHHKIVFMIIWMQRSRTSSMPHLLVKFETTNVALGKTSTQWELYYLPWKTQVASGDSLFTRKDCWTTQKIFKKWALRSFMPGLRKVFQN